MSNTIKMDAAGRVVIPLQVRERYGLADGSYRLEVSEAPEGIVLRPVAEEIPASRHESGWVVFRSGDEEKISPEKVVRDERERRHGRVRGGRPESGDP